MLRGLMLPNTLRNGPNSYTIKQFFDLAAEMNATDSVSFSTKVVISKGHLLRRIALKIFDLLGLANRFISVSLGAIDTQ